MMHNVASSWQEELSSPMERFSYIIETGTFSDLTISSLSGKLFQVHQLVLSVHSTVFDRMFYGSIIFDNSNPLNLEVESDTVVWLLNFMYKNEGLMETVEMAMDVYAFAHQWQMDLLLVRCSKYLQSRANDTNAREIMEFTCQYADDNLTECCLALLSNQQQKLILDQIEDFSREALRKMICYGGNWCSESQIFKSAYRWAEQRLREKDDEITSNNIRRELGDMLFDIKYYVMTPKEFVANVLSTNVLTDAESVNILQRLTNSDVPLLDHISTLSKRRSSHEDKTFIRTLNIYKKAGCNWKTLFHHWNMQHHEQLMVITCSENLLIRCIRMRSECFPGTWNLVIKTEDGSAVTVSNDYGPPWYFTNAVLISGLKYTVGIFGRGGKYSHSVVEFDSYCHGTFFTGQSTKCAVAIEYCSC